MLTPPPLPAPPPLPTTQAVPPLPPAQMSVAATPPLPTPMQEAVAVIAAPGVFDAAAAAAAYIALRDEKEAMEKRHKEELAPLNERKRIMEGIMLEALNAAGTDSMSAKGIGTILKATDSTASVSDGEAFRDYVIAGQRWQLIDWRANKTGVRSHIAEEKTVPPGVNFSTRITVQVRRARGTGSNAANTPSTQEQDA